jgi:hypothetical protein
MKHLAIVLLLSCSAIRADEPTTVTVKDVQNTAASLDSLLSHNKEKVGVWTQGKWHKNSKAPVNIAAVTPVVARKLQIEGSQANDLLQKDPTKLSELVMSKMLSDKTGKPWTEIIQGATEDSLIQQLQTKRIPLEKIQADLNNIYADVSFAIMDFENRYVGAAPGSEKGKDSNKDKKD